MTANRGDSGYWRAGFLGLSVLMLGSLADVEPLLSVAVASVGYVVGVVLFVLLPQRKR